jgi:hypothetical protein
MQGMTLGAIHDDLVRTLGPEMVGYSTVTKCARSANFVPKKDLPAYEPVAVDSSPVNHTSSSALRFRLSASSPDRLSFHDPLCTAPNAIPSLLNSGSVMSPPRFDRRVEADPSQYWLWAAARPIGTGCVSMTWNRHVEGVKDLQGVQKVRSPE